MSFIYADYAESWATGFQDPACDWMYAIIDLHDRIIFYLLIVLAVVIWFLISSMLNTDHMAHLHHGNNLEIAWTITPAIILWAIGLPSLRQLYMMDEILDPELSVKVMGNLLGNICPKSFMLFKIEDARICLLNLGFFTINYPCKKEIGIYTSKSKVSSFHSSSVRSDKRIGPHNIDVISILVGSLQGDGNASFRKNRKTIDGIRFTFVQSAIHREYLLWLYEFFSIRGYCNIQTPPRVSNTIVKGKTYIRYSFTTYTFKSYKWLETLFYKKGRKYINPGLYDYLTPLALAVWIMDDGGKLKDAGIRLCTNCFTYEENLILKNILEKRYELDCTLREAIINNQIQYNIYIKKHSQSRLRSIVEPYFIPSMLHKLYD